MKQSVACLLSVFAVGAIHAADYNYTWTSGENPAQTSDGRVQFAYSSDGKIKSMTADTNDGRIIFTGDAMTFDSTSAVITNSTIGEIVFQNVVTAATLTVVSTCPNSTYRYGGTATSFLTTANRVVMENAQLADWRPVKSTMLKWTTENPSGWANPGNMMHVDHLRRTADKVTFAFQTDVDYSHKDESTSKNVYGFKSLQVELTQVDNNIMGRVLVPNYWTYKLGSTFSRYDDVDDIAKLTYDGLTREARNFLYTGVGTAGYGVNTIEFVRIATKVRFEGSTGVTKLGTLIAKAYTDIQVACPNGAVDPSFKVQPADEHSHVTLKDATYSWTGTSQKASGEVIFEATSAGDAGERTVEPTDYGKTADWFVESGSVKVASNRKLTDLVTATNRAWVIKSDGSFPNGTNDKNAAIGEKLKADKNFSWCNISGANAGGENGKEIHPANLFNLKLSTDGWRTQAVVQVQCQQGALLRCVYMNLYQVGADIYASISNYKANWSYVSNDVMRADSRFPYDKMLGADFDILYNMSSADRTSYGVAINQNVARAVTKSGLGVRNLNLVFKSQVITSTKASMMAGGTYVVRGCDDATMVLNITNQGGLPTNGILRVQKGGEVWFSGTWNGSKGMNYGVSSGKCKMHVENGGRLRQLAYYPFKTSTELVLDGGFIDFVNAYNNGNAQQNQSYLYNLTMKNGAGLCCVDGRCVRLANQNNILWSIFGSSPSTNNVATMPVGPNVNTVQRSWVINVGDTGHDSDFVQNADIMSYQECEATTVYTNIVLRKRGAGTMLLNARYKCTAAFYVEDGKLLVGKSNLWSGGAPINVTGGATLAVAENTVNSFGPVNVAKNGSTVGKLEIPEGASVTFADSQGINWGAELQVTMATNSIGKLTSSLRFFGLSSSQINSTRVNGKRLHLDADGNVFLNPGMVILLK